MHATSTGIRRIASDRRDRPSLGATPTGSRELALGTLDCQMLDERKAAILRAVVEEYIETGQPVGSGHVAQAPGVDVSSATVRNEMAALEIDGFLRQPHTSAGRVPTEKGYRVFFARAHGEVEQMLSETSRLLSDLTNLTSVVVAPTPVETRLRSVQLVALTSTSAVLVAVLSDGSVEKHTVELPAGAGDERVAAASAHLAAHLSCAPRPPTSPSTSTWAVPPAWRRPSTPSRPCVRCWASSSSSTSWCRSSATSSTGGCTWPSAPRPAWHRWPSAPWWCRPTRWRASGPARSACWAPPA